MAEPVRAALSPERLAEFLDELRWAGFGLGATQYIAVQDLVLALVARGEDLERPERLKRLIGPVVCGTPQEQAEFSGLFDSWAARFQVEETAPPVDPVVPPEFRGMRRHLRWLGVVVALGLALFAFWQWELVPEVPAVDSEQPKDASPAEDTPILDDQTEVSVWSQTALALAGILLLLLAGLFVWWILVRHQTDLYLQHKQTSERPELDQLWVRRLADELFRQVQIHRLAQRLRQRRRVPSDRLDVPRTVDRSLEQGGFPSLVYETAYQSPEYLVLIDRTSFRDQRAAFVDELISSLESQEVYIDRFYFDGDPRVCFPRDRREAPARLRDMAGRYPEHRLLVVTEGDGFFDPRTGRVRSWTSVFANWATRALLTFHPRRLWSHRENQLAKDFLLVPASVSGLEELVAILHGGRSSEETEGRPEIPLPRDLVLRPRRWLGRDEQERVEIDSMFYGLRRFLGPAGMTWLAACAVYPALDWNLTVFLGSRLKDERGRRLIDGDSLPRLLRTPWLRHDFMPEWLRRELLLELTGCGGSADSAGLAHTFPHRARAA